MDRRRANREYINDIFETLLFLQILWQEGPQHTDQFEAEYSQLHRLALYNNALNQLADNRKVFACACSRTQTEPCNCRQKNISLDTPNVSWRLITGEYSDVRVKDYSGKVTDASLPIEMHNFIVRKKDGYPAYQLTSVVDDLFYNIDLIVRGQDLWHSTMAQHVLAKAIGKPKFGDITFYHHPLIMDAAGQKLSKSAGATSIKYLREKGNTATEIYGLVSELAGLNASINNWQQLTKSIT